MVEWRAIRFYKTEAESKKDDAFEGIVYSKKNLKLVSKSVRDVLRSFESYEISHIPRERNREADRLANRAIDER